MAEYYTDLDFSFGVEGDNDLKILEDSEAVKKSVENIVMTIKGEKLFDPDFGTLVRHLLFNLADYGLVFRLERQILFALSSREPRITNILVRVLVYPQDYLLVASVSYTIIGIQRRFDQVIVLNRVR